jgi:alpha-1,6-mannosyltransferase
VHVVDVCAFYSPQGGGVKTYVERKVRAARRHGVRMTILAPAREGEAFMLGDGEQGRTIPGRRFPLDGRYRYFHDEPALHAALDELAPDFVEASSPWSSASMVARWPGAAPRALVMHADPLASYAYRWFGGVFSRAAIDRRFDRFWNHLRRLDQAFDLVVCANGDLTRRMAEGGLERAITIPMGVDPGVFSPGHRDEQLRARLLDECGLGPDATLLLGVGRLASEKRWPMVIDAVMAAGMDYPIGFVLAGDGRDRAAVVSRAGHDPHIRLLAPITDRPAMARLMASADALVHGCDSETYCMVASEARASGLPLIVPDSGGAAEQVSLGAGSTYRAGDPGDLALVITELIRSGLQGPRSRAIALAGGVRSMDEHFTELFDTYRKYAFAGPGETPLRQSVAAM